MAKHRNKPKAFDGSRGVSAGSGSGRVLRGGSWLIDARGCRSAFRFYLDPGFSYGFLGLRLALVRKVK